MTTWAKVGKGDRVELKGKAYEVVKIKVDGKRAKVKVVGSAGEFTAEVKLKDAVTILEGWYKPSKAERKAAKANAKADRESAGLAPGDPRITAPPAPPSDDPWETRRDKVERKLDEILGARLVGEATDTAAGYYVPPVDVSTIRGHWMTFHEGDDWRELDEAQLMRRHEAEHENAIALPHRFPLKVNHWHTETRPNA